MSFFGCIGEHPEGEAFLNWMDGDWLNWLQTVYYGSDNAETTQHLIAAASEFGNTICGMDILEMHIFICNNKYLS